MIRALKAALYILIMCTASANAQNLTQYINSRMGTIAHGNVVIGPQLPFGAITPSPDTKLGGTDGYNSGQKIRGFSQLHVTGTGGSSKYGMFLLSPQIGLNVQENGHDADKTDEVATPSYYKVTLKDYNIGCELSPAMHSAIYRLKFPKSDKAHLFIDLGHSIPGDIYNNGYADFGDVTIDPDQKLIKGWAHYWGGWSGEAFAVYFAARYSKTARETGTWKDTSIFKNTNTQKIDKAKQRIGAYLGFDTKEGEEVQLKIAVSFVSIDQALKYLDQEIPDWDFDAVHNKADARWNEEMKKIVITGTDEQKSIFYSCLYNTMRQPHNRTGDNPHWPGTEPYWDDHYCVWDTWKTMFPLNTLINESMVRNNIKAFIDRFKHNGQVLDAYIAGNDRVSEMRSDGQTRFYRNQGGDDVDNIIADAYAKKVPGIDWSAAYQLLHNNADKERAPSYRIDDRGWIPYQSYGFGLYCSRTIEFAYNDYCVALMAKGLGKTADYQRFMKRSHNWQNLWNAGLESDSYKGFIAPKRFDGSWVPDYNPRSDHAPGFDSFVDSRSFYEGSSWVYSYVLSHDFPKLISLEGGNEAYAKRLQHALENKMIDFGNEPSFLTPFSFHYCLRPDLTSYWVRKNFANYTQTDFPGDEDSGAMSSWYVFASMGFFPVAGQNLYLLNGPLFTKAVMTMENHKQVIVDGVNASAENVYVQSVTLNGKPLERSWITHDELRNGAVLKFVMGPKPSDWGRRNLPPTIY